MQTFLSDDNNNGNCRARNDLEEERLARIDAEDVVSKLQEQLADVQHAEVTARQAAETRLSSLTQEYESMKLKVNACGNLCLLSLHHSKDLPADAGLSAKCVLVYRICLCACMC